jgi:hypothetical protein
METKFFPERAGKRILLPAAALARDGSLSMASPVTGSWAKIFAASRSDFAS